MENWKSSISNIQETVGRALGGANASNTGGGRQQYGQQQQQQQQQRENNRSVDAQDLVNAHHHNAEKGPETQQPVVEVA